MSSPLDPLADAVTALRQGWSAAGVVGSEPARLVELNRLLGTARRLLDAAASQIASEIARQSRPELGADSLAKRHGHRNATMMLATTLGTSTGRGGEAGRSG